VRREQRGTGGCLPAWHAQRTTRVYLYLARAGFRRQSQYKLAMFAGLFTNCVFGSSAPAVMMAAVRASDSFGGYDAGSIGAYVWLSQGLLGATQFMGPPLELVDRVKNGDLRSISCDLSISNSVICHRSRTRRVHDPAARRAECFGRGIHLRTHHAEHAVTLTYSA